MDNLKRLAQYLHTRKNKNSHHFEHFVKILASKTNKYLNKKIKQDSIYKLTCNIICIDILLNKAKK